MKIAIIGAGNIGASLANLLVCTDFADEIYLIDIDENLAKAKELDLQASAVILGKDIKISSGNDYAKIKNFDICVITAGLTRKPGQSREDLALNNAKIICEISKNIAKFAPKSVNIVVTNPLESMVFACYKAGNFSKNQVIGMAGELDTARAKIAYAKFHNVNPNSLNFGVYGAHNDKMVLDCQSENFDEIRNQTIKGGANITKLAGKSAYLAPAMGVLKMIKAMIKNQSVIACVIDDSEIPAGREVILNKKGVEKVIYHDIYEQIDLASIKRNLEILNLA